MPTDRPKAQPPSEERTRQIISILQRMPRRAYRIHPEAVGDIVAWLCAVRAPYAKIATQGWRGADAHERMRRKGEREYGRQMVRAIDAIMVSLTETRDADTIDAARAEWDVAIAKHSGA